VVVHIKGQRQAVSLKGAGQKVQMSKKGFAVVKASPRVKASGIIQEVQEGLFVARAGKPGVGAGIVLPESPQVTGLPAFDGLGRLFVASVWGLVVLESPATNAGPIGLKFQAPV
jgi:hypothetical protein